MSPVSGRRNGDRRAQRSRAWSGVGVMRRCSADPLGPLPVGAGAQAGRSAGRRGTARAAGRGGAGAEGGDDLRSITDTCMLKATTRIAPWHAGHASGSTSKSCGPGAPRYAPSLAASKATICNRERRPSLLQGARHVRRWRRHWLLANRQCLTCTAVAQTIAQSCNRFPVPKQNQEPSLECSSCARIPGKAATETMVRNRISTAAILSFCDARLGLRHTYERTPLQRRFRS